MMKKIIAFLMAVAFAFPTLADDNIPDPWYRGMSIGLGVPLVLPLTSANGFVGYVNKQAAGFWQKRFGIRADFALPYPLKIIGEVHGRDLDIHGHALGFHQRMVWHDMIQPINLRDDKGRNIADIDGTRGKISLQNQYIGGLIDFYPFGNTWFWGGIRFSGGYYVGKTDLNVVAKLPNYFPNADGYAINMYDDTFVNMRLDKGTRVKGSLHWHYHGPYAGFGYDIGIFRGLKLYMDFGVVFADAPRLRNRDIYVPYQSFQACIEVGGICDEWTNIDIMNLNATRDALVTQLLVGLINNPVFGGQDFSSVTNLIPPNAPEQIVGWLGSPNPAANRPPWITSVINLHPGGGLYDVVVNMENAVAGNLAAFDLQKLTDDYLKVRADTVRDANNWMKDFKIVPTVRIGFMYRF